MTEPVANVEPVLVWTYAGPEVCGSATRCPIPARWQIEAATLTTNQRHTCDNHLLGALSDLLTPARDTR